MNINKILTKNPVTIAQSFNSYFSSIPNSCIHEPLDKDFNHNSLQNFSYNTLNQTNAFSLKPTSSNEINKIIKSLKIKDSNGYDEISSRILKLSAPCILSPLTYIFNKVINGVL